MNKQKVDFNSNSNSVQLAPGLQSKPTLAPRSAHEIPHTRPECWRSSASTRNADRVCEHLCCWYLPPPPQFASSITSSTPQHYNDRSNSSSSTNVSAPIPSPKRNNPAASSPADTVVAQHMLSPIWPTLAHVSANAREEWPSIFCRHRRLLCLSVVHRHFHPPILLLQDTDGPRPARRKGTVGSRWSHPLVAFHTEESSTIPSIVENTQAGTCQVYTDATEARGRPA